MTSASTLPLEGESDTSASPVRALIASSEVLHLALLAGVCLAVFAACLMHEHRVVGRYGFAMDDAWIHATVARNLVEGHGWAIVPGRSISVSTSPAWTLATAFFYLFFSKPVLGTLALSLVCMLGVTVLSYRLIVTLTERPLIGVLGTFLLLVNPIVLWGTVSGMELPMVVLMLLLTLYLYYAWEPDSAVRRYWFPVVAAVAGMTRPELLMVTPFALLDTFWHLRSDRVRALKIVIVQGFIIAACLVPYFVFNKYSTGIWFPTSYNAKMRVRGVGLASALHTGTYDALEDALFEEPLTEVFELSHKLFNHNAVGFLLLPLGALCFTRRFGTTRATQRGTLLVLLAALMPWIMGTTSPAEHLSNHADRYYVIFPPLVILLACLGLELVLRNTTSKAVGAALAVLMLLSPIRTSGRAAQLLAYDVDSTERLYHDMGLWLKDNLDPKAILAVNDIGGIGYFARRDFIDVMGLSSPEIWPVIERPYGGRFPGLRLESYLRSQNVQYVILSPHYYPGLTARTTVYEPVMQWTERFDHHRTIAPQILYRMHWDELDKINASQKGQQQQPAMREELPD
jgi:hypothetical protein